MFLLPANAYNEEYPCREPPARLTSVTREHVPEIGQTPPEIGPLAVMSGAADGEKAADVAATSGPRTAAAGVTGMVGKGMGRSDLTRAEIAAVSSERGRRDGVRDQKDVSQDLGKFEEQQIICTGVRCSCHNSSSVS